MTIMEDDEMGEIKKKEEEELRSEWVWLLPE